MFTQLCVENLHNICGSLFYTIMRRIYALYVQKCAHYFYCVGYYNILLSTCNILTLLVVSYLNLFPQTIGESPLLFRSEYACILILYSNKVIPQMSAWLYVIVTLDRMLCVVNLNRFKFINNKRTLSLI